METISEGLELAEDEGLVLSQHERRRIKHYNSSQKILLVGEGDFSFSAALATAFGSAPNMIATSLDSLGHPSTCLISLFRIPSLGCFEFLRLLSLYVFADFLNEHYDNAFSNIVTLRRRGCVVMHGVDATHMANHPLLQRKTFDRIVFNFPFARLPKKKSRSVKIRRNQVLVSAFLENAKKMLDEDGEIHIRHKTNGLEREWGIIDLAEEQGVELARAVSFRLDDYPGYNTKFGNGGDRNFNCYPSRTFIFRRRPVSHLEAWSLDCAG
nr:uncharacterized protein At4g26485-like isoform X1 [Ipomoea trifida]